MWKGASSRCRSGLASTSIIQDDIETVHQLVLNNRRIEVHELSDCWYGSIQRIHDDRLYIDIYVKGMSVHQKLCSVK